MALVLLDVFLTVLYARAGTGVFSRRVARLLFWVFRFAARRAGGRRASALSFCGPAILVVLVLFWGAALTIGSALIIQPHLGVDIKTASGGSTP